MICKTNIIGLLLLCIAGNVIEGQQIGDFISLEPMGSNSNFYIPPTHTFQVLVEEGDLLGDGNTYPGKFDFTGYLPDNGSSVSGILNLHHENTSGAVSIMDIDFDVVLKKWNISNSEQVDFSAVDGIHRPCSGAISPWGTLISCEESLTPDGNGDGYNDAGYAIEIDPVTRTLIDQPGGLAGGDKLWALGNFRHENVAIHSNRRTVYQVADSNPGYLFKFVANTAEQLHAGALYVYVESSPTTGNWVQINNSTPAEVSSTLSQCGTAGGRVFNGGEDVEIGPDGKIYFAVKNENVIYRFNDSDPITGTNVTNFEVYVGDMSYDINFGTGTISEPWGTGNDNLAFDGDNNLWVLQDGSRDYVWVVRAGHTQAAPLVDIFARVPSGAEPTGITFTPDYKFLFISMQHPSSSNNATTQQDAFSTNVDFDKDIAMVIARNEFLGPGFLAIELSNFSGQATPDGPLLEWATVSEEYLEVIELERSNDLESWTRIQQFQSPGSEASGENYFFLDNHSLEGTNYYRLKMINSNRNFNYSEVISVGFKINDSKPIVYPNPASSHLRIKPNAQLEGPVEIRLVNNLGIGVLSGKFETFSGSSLVLDLPSLGKGIYFIIINQQGYTSSTKVFIDDRY